MRETRGIQPDATGIRQFSGRSRTCPGTLRGEGAAVPLLTILTPCFNEEANVREVCAEVRRVLAQLPDHEYEHLFIDNASTDGTVDILREIARDDPHVKVIVNTRNFGTIRSGFYGMLQGSGDAVIPLVADLQDPPDMILDFVREWHAGYKIAIGIKTGSKELPVKYRVRKFYYWLIGRLSEVELVKGFTGFGLYDREVIEQARMTGEQYPYFRGLICDFGYARSEIGYVQPARARGKTKQSLYTLYDAAMFGITSHSKVPISVRSTQRVRPVVSKPVGGAGLLHHETTVLAVHPAGHRAARDRYVLLRSCPAVLHRDPRRVHRLHPHPSPQAAVGRREGTDQPRSSREPWPA